MTDTPSIALLCPQCGGPLPRQARWRTVACPYCRAAAGRGGALVPRARFQQALQRAHAAPTQGTAWPLPDGLQASLLRWSGVAAQQALLLHGPEDRLAAEAHALRALQTLAAPGADHFSRLLPQVIEHRPGALLLRLPPALWGSLDDCLARHPQGLRDPRHLVWMGRRVLEHLRWLHAGGWAHGALHGGNWLLQPRDHGICLIGWAQAGPATPSEQARDLRQLAWTLRQARPDCGGAVGALLRRCAEDDAGSPSAEALHAELGAAARHDFGPPQFIPFDPEEA